MVDPWKITNFKRTKSELEELIIFSICVANKPAARISRAVDKLLKMSKGKTPFQKIKYLIKNKVLVEKLKECSMGQYNRINKAFNQLINSNLDLKTCSVADLEGIYGIGPKTARMFILHTRPNQQLAVIDTHLIKFLKEKGYNVPKTTPSGKKYLELEQAVIAEAKKAGKDLADFDLSNWERYAKRN